MSTSTKVNNCILSIHWLYWMSHNSVVKMLGIDVIATSHTTVNFQYGGRQRIETSLVNGDSYVKIKRWRSRDIEEKESIRVVWCG